MTPSDHIFTDDETSTLASGVGIDPSDMADAIAQVDVSAVAKNRRKAFLKLLALLQTTA